MAVPALFANHRETILASTTAMVEDVLVELGHYVNDARVEDTEAIIEWRLLKGSAELRVQIIERPAAPHLRMRSAVMILPPHVNRAAAYAHLLALNLDLCGASFACIDRQVILTAERSTLDLDRGEVLDLIRRVSDLADEQDDDLVAQFGGALGGTI